MQLPAAAAEGQPDVVAFQMVAGLAKIALGDSVSALSVPEGEEEG